MKNIKKIIPLLMIVPLLGACNNSNGKTMKKPSFAAYSNKVADYTTFMTAASEKANEGMGSLVVIEGENIKSLDKGLVIKMERYAHIDYKSEFKKTGLKATATVNNHADGDSSVDAATLVSKGVATTDTSTKAKGVVNLPETGYQEVDGKRVFVFEVLPEYANATVDKKSSQETDQYSFFKDKKMAIADNKTKQYFFTSQEEFAEDEQKSYFATTTAMSLTMLIPAFLPNDVGDYAFDRYQDDKVFTTVFKEENKGVTVKYDDESYTVSCKTDVIYQYNFVTMTGAYSIEKSFEMTGDSGTHTYSFKEYMVLSATNKKVNVKAPDLAKFKFVESN